MYTRINNLTDSEFALANTELAALSKVWKERKSELERSGEYQEFLKKLQREWSIETGIIEHLYTWDRGVTEVLIEQGIETSIIAHKSGLRYEQADEIRAIIEDQLGAIDALFTFVKGEKELTEYFIRAMHAQFTAHQEYTEAQTPEGQRIHIKLLRGEYKKLPNNPRREDGTIHEYCPPEFTKEEMENLVAWYKEAENHFSPEVLSAWLHHRFTQIHPFQDGNGRVARALATLVFLKAGMFPLVIRDRDRKQYITALEEADAGNIADLVQIFAKRQKESILAALGLEQQVQQSRYAEEIISSAIKVLKDRVAGETEKMQAVYRIADQLHQIASEQLGKIAELINPQLITVTPRWTAQYKATVKSADNNAADRHFFHHQIIDIAKHFDYYANLEKHRSWVRLSIATDEQFEFVISLHGFGYWDSGIMVATAFTCQRVAREGGFGTDVINTRSASPDLFQFNYEEDRENIERRFREWLEASIAIALAEWRRLLQA